MSVTQHKYVVDRPTAIQSNVISFPSNQYLLAEDPTVHPVDLANIAWEKRKKVDALKSTSEINELVRYFLDRDEIRNALIFIFAVNTGMRIGDVLMMRWKDLLVDTNHIVTQKTRKEMRFYPNQAVQEVTKLYRSVAQQQRPCRDDDYVFISEGRHAGHTVVADRKLTRDCQRQTMVVQPLRVETVSRMFTKAGKETGLANHERRISTHTCRKTHADAMNGQLEGFKIGDDLMMRATGIMLAQAALGHAKPETTIEHYLSNDTVLHQECCRRMNFGLEEVQAYKRRKGID